MLIKVTNKCGMGCSHCMENSTPAGQHMTEQTFFRALDFTRRMEAEAYEAGCPPVVLLSGGECTEHPDFVKYLETVVACGFFPMLITNGLWLGNKELREAVLRPEWPHLLVQVVNDSRFYPTAPPQWDDKRVVYADYVPLLMKLGRASRRRPQPDDPPGRKAPASFNLRSLTRTLRSFSKALAVLRSKAAMGGGGQCTPSICDNGDVMAGETRNCWKIGTVESTNGEITKNLLDMGECNRCGLEDALSQEHKRAIGLSTLYLGSER